jgi:hypothetical protein
MGSSPGSARRSRIATRPLSSMPSRLLARNSPDVMAFFRAPVFASYR